MTVRGQAFSAIRWTTFSSVARSLFQVIQLAILARLLTPSDFGLIALIISLLAFLQIFSDFGISNAIIYYQDITRDELSSLYWINIIFSGVIAITLIILSGYIAKLYNHPELQPLLILSAAILLIAASWQQLRVLSEKNLHFEKLARIEIIAALLGFISSVLLALIGFGVYSVLLGSLVNSILGCILAWMRLSGGWRPLLHLRFYEAQKFLRFGAYMIANNLVNYLNSQIDILLGGYFLATKSVGLYSVPKDLSLRIAGIINPIITQVGLPIMARAQNDHELVKKIYLKTIYLSASINFPIYFALCLFSEEVVNILLGAQWQEAIPVLRIFSMWALMRSIINPVGSLLISQGRADLSLKWNSALLILAMPAIWLGSRFGVLGIASAMLILVGFLAFWPNWYFLVHPLCGVRFREYISQLVMPLSLSTISILFGYSIILYLDNQALRLIFGCLFGGLAYIILSWLFSRDVIYSILELFKIKK